jgi:hypothetical protein
MGQNDLTYPRLWYEVLRAPIVITFNNWIYVVVRNGLRRHDCRVEIRLIIISPLLPFSSLTVTSNLHKELGFYLQEFLIFDRFQSVLEHSSCRF